MAGRPASAEPAGRPGGRRPDDPRSIRTRARIRRAILDAVEAAEDLGALSVAEVCRRAGVHRVTFYGHWVTLDEAVADAFAEIVDDLAAVSSYEIATSSSPQDLARAYDDEALQLQVAELVRRRSIYRRLFPSSPAFTLTLEQSMRRRAEAAISTLERVGVQVPGTVGRHGRRRSREASTPRHSRSSSSPMVRTSPRRRNRSPRSSPDGGRNWPSEPQPRRPKGHQRRRGASSATGAGRSACGGAAARLPPSRDRILRIPGRGEHPLEGILAPVLVDPLGEALGVLAHGLLGGQRAEGLVALLVLLAQQHHHRQQGPAVDVTAGHPLLDPPVGVVGGRQVQRLPRTGEIIEVAAPGGLFDRGFDAGDAPGAIAGPRLLGSTGSSSRDVRTARTLLGQRRRADRSRRAASPTSSPAPWAGASRRTAACSHTGA